MSFKSKLNVAGKECNIISADFGMLQEADATDGLSSVTRGDKVTITVESTGDTDLFKWMTDSFERKDESIIFLKGDSETTLKKPKLKEAYIVKCKEDFDVAGDNPLTETFMLSAKEIEMDTAKHVSERV